MVSGTELEVGIKFLENSAGLPCPEYNTENASGIDLFAALDEGLSLHPSQFSVIPTGISLEIPVGYEAQIRARSGLAAKYGITVLNSPGTIDADYRGELKVVLSNFGQQNFNITRGDRVAQLVFASVERARFQEKDVFENTGRGEEGLGSTGYRLNKQDQ